VIGKPGLARERHGDSELSHFTGLERESDALASQELTEARFAAYAVLEPQDSHPEQLCEGIWGYVKLANVAEERLGVWIYEKIAVYLTNRWEQVSGGR